MEENSLFRNVFNAALIESMTKNITAVFPGFDKHQFQTTANYQLNQLALKERNAQITASLIKYLPQDFSNACKIIVNSMKKNPFPYKGNWDSFYYMPFGTFVAEKGRATEHLAQSFEALREITIRFTSEFAIRPFINQFPTEPHAQLNQWKRSKNENIRRLCSEGSRPRLPWAEKIQAHINDPGPCFTILKDLMHDQSLYVKKSVANHLNDISKDNPTLVMEFLQAHQNTANKDTLWICKKALRTLVKKGSPEALAFLGYAQNPKIKVSELKVISTEVALGETLQFECCVTNTDNKPLDLMIDYLIYHLKSNGQLLPKVFKLKTINLHAGETITIKKKHSFKIISTRKYYAGKHQVAIQINGNEQPKKTFQLSG